MSAKSELAVYKAQCAGPLYPLKAIGQDAVSCGSRVVGRVRNQAFVIEVSGPFPPQALHEKVIAAAEQVSGNLF
jgi:hypothetical protein